MRKKYKAIFCNTNCRHATLCTDNDSRSRGDWNAERGNSENRHPKLNLVDLEDINSKSR